MNLRTLALIASLSTVACDAQNGPPAVVAADAIYVNAKIYTVDESASWAEALAVRDGKIVALGKEADVRAEVGNETRIIDVGGKMLMPGIHDTHIHPSDAGVQKRLQCSFLSNDIDEVVDILKRCAADLADGEWLRGGQWNDGLFASGKTPKDILDEVSSERPIFLMDWSVHNAWVNSKALAIFGIDNDTPDPAGGVIVRNLKTGVATGILLDNAAYDYRRTLPDYSLAERTDALAWSIDEITRYGVTTIKEALVTTGVMAAYHALEKRGDLPLRVKTNLTWKSSWAKSHDDEVTLIDSHAEHAAERIDTTFAKIMLDGIPPTYTAAMLDPYEPSEAFGDDWRGQLMFTPEELAADVTALDSKGLAVKIHATGDRSARVALDAIEAARKANGDSGLIHEVSHAELIHPDDIPRFAELNVAAEMCPILWYPIPGLDWDHWLGPDRQVWPVKALVDAGALVTYGSDWAVVPTPNPWPGIEAMVTRSDPVAGSGATLWAEQAVDLATAIQIFTINSAIANKAGARSGSLAAGKDADFIVLDRNIFEIPINEVGETEVLLSVIAGKPIIDKRPLPD